MECTLERLREIEAAARAEFGDAVEVHDNYAEPQRPFRLCEVRQPSTLAPDELGVFAARALRCGLDVMLYAGESYGSARAHANLPPRAASEPLSAAEEQAIRAAGDARPTTEAA